MSPEYDELIDKTIDKMATELIGRVPRIQPSSKMDYYEIANEAAKSATRWNPQTESFEDLPGLVEINLSCGTDYSGETGLLSPTMTGHVEHDLDPFGTAEAGVLLRVKGLRWDGTQPIYTYEVERIID